MHTSLKVALASFLLGSADALPRLPFLPRVYDGPLPPIGTGQSSGYPTLTLPYPTGVSQTGIFPTGTVGFPTGTVQTYTPTLPPYPTSTGGNFPTTSSVPTQPACPSVPAITVTETGTATVTVTVGGGAPYPTGTGGPIGTGTSPYGTGPTIPVIGTPYTYKPRY